ncbi:2-hydroxyacyl-CoA dehydratase [Sinomonas flava]|uniref:2-hydroxyacyl-CoA dehydratase n=1 Tax=Sinomonas flava TaxID=496857 RepID=UPI0039A62BFC
MSAETALGAAAEHYVARLERARAAASAGRCVIGLVGADVPRELIAAAGALPYRLHSGGLPPSEEAVRLLGAAIDPVAPVLLTQLLAGELDFLAGLVFSRDCEASLQLFYVVRELSARRPGLPPVHLVDLLHLPRESTVRYDRAQVEACAEVLASWTGRAPEGEALLEAMNRYRALRAELVHAQELRRDGRLGGRDSLHLFAAADSLDADDAASLIRAAVAERQGAAPTAARHLFFSGSSQDDDAVYAALESLGLHIVGEDHDWGQLQLTVDTSPASADPLDVLAAAYHRRGPAAASSSIGERAAWSAGQARSAGAEGVLCYTRAFDDAPAWDYPVQREHLHRVGIASVLLDRQPLDPHPEALREAVDGLFGTAAPETAEADTAVSTR